MLLFTGTVGSFMLDHAYQSCQAASHTRTFVIYLTMQTDERLNRVSFNPCMYVSRCLIFRHVR